MSFGSKKAAVSSCTLCSKDMLTTEELHLHEVSLVHHIQLEKRAASEGDCNTPQFIHSCRICHFSASNLADYSKHLNDKKHIERTNFLQQVITQSKEAASSRRKGPSDWGYNHKSPLVSQGVWMYPPPTFLQYPPPHYNQPTQSPQHDQHQQPNSHCVNNYDKPANRRKFGKKCKDLAHKMSGEQRLAMRRAVSIHTNQPSTSAQLYNTSTTKHNKRVASVPTSGPVISSSGPVLPVSGPVIRQEEADSTTSTRSSKPMKNPEMKQKQIQQKWDRLLRRAQPPGMKTSDRLYRERMNKYRSTNLDSSQPPTSTTTPECIPLAKPAILPSPSGVQMADLRPEDFSFVLPPPVKDNSTANQINQLPLIKNRARKSVTKPKTKTGPALSLPPTDVPIVSHCKDSVVGSGPLQMKREVSECIPYTTTFPCSVALQTKIINNPPLVVVPRVDVLDESSELPQPILSHMALPINTHVLNTEDTAVDQVISLIDHIHHTGATSPEADAKEVVESTPAPPAGQMEKHSSPVRKGSISQIVYAYAKNQQPSNDAQKNTSWKESEEDGWNKLLNLFTKEEKCTLELEQQEVEILKAQEIYTRALRKKLEIQALLRQTAAEKNQMIVSSGWSPLQVATRVFKHKQAKVCDSPAQVDGSNVKVTYLGVLPNNTPAVGQISQQIQALLHGRETEESRNKVIKLEK